MAGATGPRLAIPGRLHRHVGSDADGTRRPAHRPPPHARRGAGHRGTDDTADFAEQRAQSGLSSERMPSRDGSWWVVVLAHHRMYFGVRGLKLAPSHDILIVD